MTGQKQYTLQIEEESEVNEINIIQEQEIEPDLEERRIIKKEKKEEKKRKKELKRQQKQQELLEQQITQIEDKEVQISQENEQNQEIQEEIINQSDNEEEIKVEKRKKFLFNSRKKIKLSQEPTTFIQLDSISIAIPDSIIQIAQSAELRSYFISEIARSAAIFKIDEIIVLKDHAYKTKSPNFDALSYVCRNLQYLETPQYLRKYLFPIHPDLKYTGLMNPIESRNHLKADEYSRFREGVVCNRPVKANQGSWADIGFKKLAQLDYNLQPNTRVTVKLLDNELETQNKCFTGKVVSQITPYKESGIYWGYQVRIANYLEEVYRASFNQQGYQYKICIGKQGVPIDLDILRNTIKGGRVLIVFGGHEGIEPVVDGDEKSRIRKENLHENFDFYFCLNESKYGVKSLRVEEEINMFLQIMQTIFQY